MYEDYLVHHGVLGQKWGVRRFQNADGSLTDSGRKRLAGNKEITLQKGTEFNRVSKKKTTDIGKDNSHLYVTADPNEADKFKSFIGGRNIVDTGKSYAQKYIANNDIVIPSTKLQNKIANDMLKNKEIRQELQDSFMKKGYTREQASELVQSVSTGKEIVNGMLTGAGVMALQTAPLSIGATAGIGPLGGAAVTGFSGAVGALMGVGLGALSAKTAKEEKARVVANAIGDKNNKKLAEAYTKALADKGYNAYRDYNDKTNDFIKSTSAIVLTNPKENAKLFSSKEMKKSDYAESYAKYKWDEMSNKQRQEITYESLKKDGERQYDSLIKEHKTKLYKERLKKKIDKIK